jgi:hypothetical protein
MFGQTRAYSALMPSHFSSPASVSGLIASTGHSGSQTPQSMHSSGSCLIPRFDLGLVVQNYIQQGIMDFQFSVVFDGPNLRNLFMKKLTRDRVVPIISASVS